MLENNFSLLNLYSEFNIFLPKVTDIWGKAYIVFDFWLPVSLDWARGAIFRISLLMMQQEWQLYTAISSTVGQVDTNVHGQ